MESNTHTACSVEPMQKPDHKAKRHGKPNCKPNNGKTRPEERVGGGHFVFRRSKSNHRIWPGKRPFEHPNHASALAEAERLHVLDGDQFDVLSVANCIGGNDYDA